MRKSSVSTSPAIRPSNGPRFHLPTRGIRLYDRPMRNATLLSTVLLATAACLSGQDRLVPIDNDQARVLKVVAQSHAKGQPHEHKINRVMIYLTRWPTGDHSTRRQDSATGIQSG